MKNGTRSFSAIDMDWVESHPSEQGMDAWNRLPYHLQYLKDGKVNIKPEDKTDETVLRKQQ